MRLACAVRCGLVVACLPLGAANALASEPVSASVMAGRLDAALQAAQKQADVQPASPADDAEFLRRAYLDLTGKIPAANEVRTFLADESTDKREALIEQLLARPGHANHMATTWRKFLLPENSNLVRFGTAVSFENWLADQFADNTPYDKIARELLTATGQYNQGPALFYVALEVKPEELAAATSR